MIIDTEKLNKLAQELSADIAKMYSKVGVTIGCVDGVWFRLEALDQKEAHDTECDQVLARNKCFSEE